MTTNQHQTALTAAHVAIRVAGRGNLTGLPTKATHGHLYEAVVFHARAIRAAGLKPNHTVSL